MKKAIFTFVHCFIFIGLNAQNVSFDEAMIFFSQPTFEKADSILSLRGFQKLEGTTCNEWVYINSNNPFEKLYLQKRGIFYETNDAKNLALWQVGLGITTKSKSISNKSQAPGPLNLDLFLVEETYPKDIYFFQWGISIGENRTKIYSLSLFDKAFCYFEATAGINKPKSKQL